MKFIIIAFITISSFSALASNYDNILCGNAAGYTSGDFSPYSNVRGCIPTLKCATDRLAASISQIPEANTAGYSETLEGFVDVSKKTISRMTLDSTMSRAPEYSCEGRDDNQVDCIQATACASVSVEYTKCTKVSYDSQTGDKIVTCPSGRVIR